MICSTLQKTKVILFLPGHQRERVWEGRTGGLAENETTLKEEEEEESENRPPSFVGGFFSSRCWPSFHYPFSGFLFLVGGPRSFHSSWVVGVSFPLIRSSLSCGGPLFPVPFLSGPFRLRYLQVFSSKKNSFPFSCGWR